MTPSRLLAASLPAAAVRFAARRLGRSVGVVLPERSIAMLRTGYPYLLRLRRGADTAEIRLFGGPATIVSGPDGARLFYDESVMQRQGATPRPLRRTLFGDEAVHGLDGAEHQHRKALFLDLLTPAAAQAIAEFAAARWRTRADRPVDPVRLFDEAVDVHGGAICEWSGCGDGYPRLGRDLAAIVDGFGTLGWRHVLARRARRRADRWASELVRAVRARSRPAMPGSALAVIAAHQGRDGRLLAASVAGVELLNVLRPTVAVAYFVAFTADALARDPSLRERLRSASAEEYEGFAHELRRYYPFVPMLVARARRPVSFAGRAVPHGRRVVLDVYGTLHEGAAWPDPNRFDLDRFLGVEPDPFGYLPQGGGSPIGHRCPGERVAVELIKTATRHLVTDRPPLSVRAAIPLHRMPTRPLP